MKRSLKGNKFNILLFSLTCVLVIFTLHKSFTITSPNSVRKLIEENEYNCRCKETLKKFTDNYAENPPNNTLNKNIQLGDYQRVLKELIQNKEYEKIRKYLPRIYVYLIVAILDIIFIIFWILFCCYSCRNVEKQNRIGCGAKCSFIIYFILCLAVIGCCVIGFIYYPHVIKGLNNLGCSIYKMVFHTLNGFEDKNEYIDWIGINATINNITNLDNSDYKTVLDTIKIINKTFAYINDKTLTDIEEILEKVEEYKYPISIGIYGGIALFNLLGLISIFLIFVCECKCMSCLFHLFWNIEILFIIATFCLSAGLGTSSIVSKDLSDILENHKNYLNESFIINLSEIEGAINICLNGDGDLITYILQYNADKFYTEMEGRGLLRKHFNCSYFALDYKIITDELKDTVAKKLYCMSLLLIIIDVIGIISIFIGITVYNSQKKYYPPESEEVNVNINNNNRMMNNRVDLSTENLKRQNNEIIFNKNIK